MDGPSTASRHHAVAAWETWCVRESGTQGPQKGKAAWNVPCSLFIASEDWWGRGALDPHVDAMS